MQEQLNEVVDMAWQEVKDQVDKGQLTLVREGNFGLHLGIFLYAFGNRDVPEGQRFEVEAEHLLEVDGARKYMDLACSYQPEDIKAALELKFCTAQQGADNLRRVDFWQDLGTLEEAQRQGFGEARFLLITDDPRYPEVKRRGDYKKYSMHEGRVIEPGQYECVDWAGRRGKSVTLEKAYPISWEKINGLNFLELKGE